MTPGVPTSAAPSTDWGSLLVSLGIAIFVVRQFIGRRRDRWERRWDEHAAPVLGVIGRDITAIATMLHPARWRRKPLGDIDEAWREFNDRNTDGYAGV